MRRPTALARLVPLVALAVLLGAAPPAAAAPGDFVPWLQTAHVRPGGGINLWRAPVGSAGLGEPVAPALVATLDTGGFRFDQSRTGSGVFAPVGSPPTPDALISHQQPNGGVLLWVVPVSTGQPEVWADLRGGGWSWADSRQYVGDVDGDRRDDVVSVHRNDWGLGAVGVNVWVHRNTGSGFADPQLWATIMPRDIPGAEHIDRWEPFVDSRFLVGDVNGDRRADLSMTHRANGAARGYGMIHTLWQNTGGSFANSGRWEGARTSQGWSFDASRDLLQEIDGYGRRGLTIVHQQPGDGVLVFHRPFHPENGGGWSGVWLASDLRAGGWSWSGSRQVAADIDSDGREDLLSVHAQVSGGELVWAHTLAGPFEPMGAPVLVGDLRSGGWDFRTSTETVSSPSIWH
ncbi:hypothetical protein [Cellulomonas xylanilytica]|uniref:Uncharacterized protein n=1 Tax=Cellulomonas xylanilytica TaxID=233583 RepID=A0A510V5T7_9CELL|nr:hypothetical protein [Cellulomonas xylanilytica]GEK22234.1 hypothetical protein CXY01_27540 [Cellulomonas xylanilytica]